MYQSNFKPLCFVFVFLRENFRHIKSTKSTKSIKSIKSTKRQASDFLPLRCFYEHKKHKKHNFCDPDIDFFDIDIQNIDTP